MFTVLWGLSFSGFSQEVFVDIGACPGEGCGYGEQWLVEEMVDLYRQPTLASITGVQLQRGEQVQTLKGEVHTIPGRLNVNFAYEDFKIGDDVFLLTYLGEGWFKLRHNGQIKEADLQFSPWGGSSGKRCESGTRCWGSLQEELEFEWWVKIHYRDGEEAWTRDYQKFTGFRN